MTIKKLTNEWIPKPNRSLIDVELIYITACSLPVTKDGRGDCIEVDADPKDIRFFGYTDNRLFTIRLVAQNVWRIWRIK